MIFIFNLFPLFYNCTVQPSENCLKNTKCMTAMLNIIRIAFSVLKVQACLKLFETVYTSFLENLKQKFSKQFEIFQNTLKGKIFTYYRVSFVYYRVLITVLHKMDIHIELIYRASFGK